MCLSSVSDRPQYGQSFIEGTFIIFLQVIFDEIGALNISVNQNFIECMQFVHENILLTI